MEDLERHRPSFNPSRIKVLVEQLNEIEKIMANAMDGERFEAKLGDRSDSKQGNMAEVAPHPPLIEIPTQGRQGMEEVRTPFKADFYQKLPHPLAQWFKELPVIDGSKINLLCIRQFGLFSEPIIYEVLYPYCQGEPLIVLSNALTRKEPFDSFHARLLQTFYYD